MAPGCSRLKMRLPVRRLMYPQARQRPFSPVPRQRIWCPPLKPVLSAPGRALFKASRTTTAASSSAPMRRLGCALKTRTATSFCPAPCGRVKATGLPTVKAWCWQRAMRGRCSCLLTGVRQERRAAPVRCWLTSLLIRRRFPGSSGTRFVTAPCSVPSSSVGSHAL